MAIAIIVATAQLSKIKATTVTESVATPVPTVQPTLSCTSTYFLTPYYSIHNVDVNNDNQFTIFDLVRIKESIVNNPDNIYTVKDLLHLQYVLLGIQKPCLCDPPLPAVTPTTKPEEN